MKKMFTFDKTNVLQGTFETSKKAILNTFLNFIWVVIFLFSFNLDLTAQFNPWTEKSEIKNAGRTDIKENIPDLELGAAFELNMQEMVRIARASKNESRGTNGKSAEVELPLPNGEFERFEMYESSLMSPGLQAKYPSIRTYVIRSKDDPYTSGRMVVSPNGFSAKFVSVKENYEVYIAPIFSGDVSKYLSYYGKDHPQENKPLECLQDGVFDPSKAREIQNNNSRSSTGDKVRVYRIAVILTGAVSDQYGFTTHAEALTEVVLLMSNVNAIYERDFSIRFVLAENNDALIFLDHATDPFTVQGGGASARKGIEVMNEFVGFENYDIGMTLVKEGCCAAGKPTVCGVSKGWNFSRLYNPRVTSHEIGHQFDCDHTWTACGAGVNNGQYGTNEYGSGTSIMSYAGICGVDNIIPRGDPHFFGAYSYVQANNRVDNTSCYFELDIGNSAPVVTLPADGFYIPIETPFKLTGSATDANNDHLTYSWEQLNIRGIDYATAPLSIHIDPVAADGNVPIQRIFNPVTTPDRIIPQLSDLLNNTSSVFERLPTYTRNIKYGLFVRDNHLGGGGVTLEELSFEVDGTAGPFLVTAPNTCVSWTAGSSQTITWDVANTDNANVNVQQVNILLSTDGGYTWPHILATSTANDGSESVTLPSGICSNLSRIKVEAEGNIFFDISNENFDISDASPITEYKKLVLDGIDDYVSINSTLGNFGTNDFSMEFWVKTTALNGNLISKRGICGCDNFWNFWMSGGKLNLTLSETGCSNYSSQNSNVAIDDGAWHHIAWVREGTNATVYIDGVLDFSFTSSQDLNNTTDLLIGSNACPAPIATEYDEIRFWDDARTASEITANMNCLLTGAETNLTAYYPLNDATCGTCLVHPFSDKSTNSNDGALINGATLELSPLEIFECPTCTNGDVTISSHPASQTITQGAAVTFSAAATGSNLSYIWQVSTDAGLTFANLSSANSNALTFTTDNEDGYVYRTLILNGCDVDTTTAATLSLTCTTPTISSIQGPANPCADNYYTYYVTPVADVVTWNWTTPAGWSTSGLGDIIFVAPSGTAGNIEVYGVDACGNNTNTQTLAVVPSEVEITTHPQSLTVSEGSAISFSTTVASGGGTDIFQWQHSNDGGENFVNISGANSSTYNISAAGLALDDFEFRCLVDNDCLHDTTNVASLIVNCVTSAPQTPGAIIGSSVVCNGSILSYSIPNVAGASSYIWTLPTGWTGSSTSNSITVTSTATGGVLQVQATNSCGTSDSRNLKLSVSAATCQNAVHYDGVDDFINVGQNSQYLNSDMTISLWVNPQSITDRQTLVYNGYEFIVYLVDGKIEFSHYIVGGGYNNSVELNFDGANISSNKWTHIGLTRNTSTSEVSLYVDGVFVETKTWDSSAPSTPDDTTLDDMLFGADANGVLNHFHGAMDEIKIWDDIRTATEIADDMYCKPVGSEANLLAYYGFEEGQPGGNNVGVVAFANAASAYLSASPNNMNMNGPTSNVADGTKGDAIAGLSTYCAGIGTMDFIIDLPGTPNVTWNLPSGWTGSSTTESITVTPDGTGGVIQAVASLTCGSITLQKSISSTPLLTIPSNTRGIDLDGTDDHLTIPSGAINLNSTSFTIEVWAKRTGVGENDYLLIQGNSGSNTKMHVGFRNSNAFTFAFYSNDLNAPTNMSDNKWNHWACVYDKSIADPAHNRFIYRNGILVASDRSSSDFLGSGITYLGRNSSDYFEGRMDELRVWNDARSQAEIQANYYCTIDCPPTELALYLPMEDGVVNGNNSGLIKLTDYSSYGNSVDVVNMAMDGTTSNIVEKVDRLRYLDMDGDNFGDPATATGDFCLTGNYIYNTGDCKDDDNTVHPNAVEICGNSIDDDCDGYTDIEINKALNFDESSSNLLTTPLIPISGSFTIETWFKGSGNTGVRDIFYVTDGTDSWEFGVWDNQIGFLRNNSGWKRGDLLDDNAWHHLMFRFDSSNDNVKLYLDGGEELSATYDADWPATGTYIGSSSWNGRKLNGALDEFRFWNKLFTPEEIANRSLRKLDGDETDLLRYYSFDQGIPSSDNPLITQLKDGTANANHADLIDFNLTGSTSNWVVGETFPTYYFDGDMDGFAGNTQWSCGTMIQNYQDFISDCDDTNNAIHPNAIDICGNAADENCNGIDDEQSMAINFDGTDDFVDFGNSMANFGTSDFTIEFAINTTSTAQGYIVSKSGAAVTDAGFYIAHNNGIITYSSFEAGFGNFATISGTTAINDGNWHYVAVVRENGTTKLFVDGQRDESFTTAVVTNFTTNSNNWILGKDNAFPGPFNGSIDELRFWDSARSATEINLLKAASLSVDAGMLAYYDFNNGMAGHNISNAGVLTVEDRTANNIDGTLTNFGLTGTTSNWIGNPVVTQLWYADSDGDNYGDPMVDSISCTQPVGYIADSTDCDDTMINVNPGVIEVPGNSIDDNCDGAVDEISEMKWVLIDNGTMEGSCTSGTDCCTNTFCFGLEYSPATTGTLAAYTTGFFTDCVAGASPLISNVSCVMTDNSNEIEDCGGSGTILINASGNTGSLAITSGSPVIIHQLCISIPAGTTTNLMEDLPTDLSVSIDLPGGGAISENPIFTTTSASGNLPPVIIPGSLGACYDSQANAEAAAIAATSATDDCVGTITYSASTSGTCTAVITVTAMDACGLSSSVDYNTSIHLTAPTEDGGPVSTSSTVECLSAATAPTTLPVVKDACGTTIVAPTPVVTDSPDPLTCEGTRTYTYTYSDCANLDFVWTYTYTIDHSTAPTEDGGPVATTATVECLTAATAPTTLPVVKDVCGLTISAPTPVVTDSPDPLTCEGSRTYTYTYTDCSNLDFVWTYTYTIDHSTIPAEDGGPVATSSTVECLSAATAPAILPVVKDVCGATIVAPTPVVADSPDPLTCEGSRTYTYTYTDCSNLDFVWTYTYTIDHSTVPAEDGGPVANSSTVECLSAATAPATLPVVKDVCGATIVAPTPVVTDSPDPLTCEGTRTYSYTYTDCANLDFIWTYTYTIDHSTAPSEDGIAVATASTVECLSAATSPATLPIVKDVCGIIISPPLPVVTDSPDPLTCEGTRTYSYTYTDCANLDFVWTYTYTIDHSTAPSEDGGPVSNSSTVECLSAAVAPNILPTIKDICGTTIATPTPMVTDSPDPITCEGTRTYSYTYTDCANVDFVWTYTYTIDLSTAPSELGGPVDIDSTLQNIADTIAPTILPVFEDVCGNVLTPTGPVIGGTYTLGSCSGTVTYTYTYLDCANQSTDWIYTYTIDCGLLNIYAFMEGPYNSSGDTLVTTLNTNHLLPGMDKNLSASLAVRLSAPQTPFGHPYIDIPWNYTGNLGLSYGEATAPSAPASTVAYPDHVVDWILVSVRENGIAPTDDVFECAGWLHSDGSISFPEDCTAGFTINVASDYYVVLQHRNHLPVMDTATIMGGGSYLEIDFRIQDSYSPNVFRVGQKELEPGVWGMYNSNGEQEISILGINSVDRSLWRSLQNKLGYFLGDYDLNLNVNSQDETLWKINQNKTTGVQLD